MKVAQAKNGQAYQVMFDDSQQKMKMQKPATASFNHSKLPPIVMKGQGPGQDLRRLSAQNWRKQRKQVNANLARFLSVLKFSAQENVKVQLSS